MQPSFEHGAGRFFAAYPRATKIASALCLVPALVVGGVGLEALARAHLPPAGSAAPTRLYARPSSVAPGDLADSRRVRQSLQRLGYRPAQGNTVASGEYRLDPESWTVGRRPFLHAAGFDSGGVTRVRVENGRVTAIEDVQDLPLPALALEPEVLRTVHGTDLADRVPVPLESVPPYLVQAILAVEDRRFYSHGGLDLFRVGGAALANARAGRITQGGSTITQQLARTLWLSRSRTAWRKVREIAMAQVLELRYPKERILEAYLNEVYLGQDGALAVRGVGRAAQHYFGKDVRELDLGESAMLAGIIRAPSLYGPFRDRNAARGRRDLVLDLLLQQEKVTEQDHHAARRASLVVRRPTGPAERGRFFSDWVLADLAERHTLGEGLAVFTTLDAGLQRSAEDAVTRGVERLEREHPALARDDKPLEAALVALDPRSGEVLALVGGRHYGTSQFNRAIQAHRQPGSAFKPIVALSALMPHEASPEGPQFTLATELVDEPLAVDGPDETWVPVNYDSSYTGRVTLREALERSLNVPFAWLGMMVGPDRIAETGYALGLEGPLRTVPSLALGASEVTPLELTRAYGVFAAYGFRANTIAVLGVRDPAGGLLDSATVSGEQVADSAVAYLVTSALQGVVNQGTGAGLRAWGVGGPMAGKTGTTDQNRDAWFVGYSPTLAIGVWVGFDDGRSLSLSGAGAALPIFADFVRNAGVDPESDFPVPNGVEFARAGQNCRSEAFLSGTAPADECEAVWAVLRPVGDGLKSFFRGLKRLFGNR